ncbi:hypothetical protein [Phaeobacter inhibens]|uniref:hypothetical protein n=1 Tax=Phaeobacter inhibens TaxID=221822 RepID=UPI00076BB572|nr:hypothetical protein [Phaeobacter inhibens]KXF91751.1 hypothetical protein AT574_05095 [Phaeobacter inhibens]WHP70084.1 hypothetical protein QMZ01_07905 [Phaeobacter inhibens]
MHWDLRPRLLVWPIELVRLGTRGKPPTDRTPIDLLEQAFSAGGDVDQSIFALTSRADSPVKLQIFEIGVGFVIIHRTALFALPGFWRRMRDPTENEVRQALHFQRWLLWRSSQTFDTASDVQPLTCHGSCIRHLCMHPAEGAGQSMSSRLQNR